MLFNHTQKLQKYYQITLKLSSIEDLHMIKLESFNWLLMIIHLLYRLIQIMLSLIIIKVFHQIEWVSMIWQSNHSLKLFSWSLRKLIFIITEDLLLERKEISSQLSKTIQWQYKQNKEVILKHIIIEPFVGINQDSQMKLKMIIQKQLKCNPAISQLCIIWEQSGRKWVETSQNQLQKISIKLFSQISSMPLVLMGGDQFGIDFSILMRQLTTLPRQLIWINKMQYTGTIGHVVTGIWARWRSLQQISIKQQNWMDKTQ